MEWLGMMEWVATVFGIVCVWLMARQHILGWPAGIISTAIYSWIFFESRLYSDAILNVIYVGLNVYGWWYWSRADGTRTHQLPVTYLRTATRIAWAVLIVVGTLLWGKLMATHTDADFPYFDAFTTVASLVAQYLMARKKLENWLIWIIVDVAAIQIYYLKGLYVTSFLFVVYLLLSIKGWVDWKRAMSSSVVWEEQEAYEA